MANKSKVIRCPKDFLLKVENLKKEEMLGTRSEAMRKMAFYSNIGKQITKKDLLNANVVWFNEHIAKTIKPKKKRLFKK